jgi:cation:H+ antiporter
MPAGPASPPGETNGGTGLRGTVVRLGIAAVVILVSGPVVAAAADGIVRTSGLDATFIGAVLLAGATSLPELVVSLTAVRLGAFDVAVGNLFGSNALNMVVVLPVDIVTAEPVLRTAAPSVAVAAAAAVGLMAMALAAIVTEEPTSARRLEPDALAVLIAYGAALVLVWFS